MTDYINSELDLPIGNRRSATENTDLTTTYTANKLNQYTELSGAKTATPLHDDDGNVTDYKKMKYSSNAENQMISAEPKNPAEGDKKTEYLYDYMGRRAGKQVFSRNADNSGWNAAPDTEKLFVYDGWNLIKEITKSGGTSSDKFYVWGPDLSQSLQGAGGIGGLVCAVHAGEVRHYFYDANGNVGQVVNETGAIVARYEYDPFGNAIVTDGSYAQENPFRFSTKYYDEETGLYYYGFRDYSAELGRWWSRDPIEENGGVNLYGFVGNDGIGNHDMLGLLKAVFYDPGNFPTQAAAQVRKWEEQIKREGKCEEIRKYRVTDIETFIRAIRDMREIGEKISAWVLMFHAGGRPDYLTLVKNYPRKQYQYLVANDLTADEAKDLNTHDNPSYPKRHNYGYSNIRALPDLTPEKFTTDAYIQVNTCRGGLPYPDETFFNTESPITKNRLNVAGAFYEKYRVRTIGFQFWVKYGSNRWHADENSANVIPAVAEMKWKIFPKGWIEVPQYKTVYDSDGVHREDFDIEAGDPPSEIY